MFRGSDVKVRKRNMSSVALAVIIFVPMLIEARRASSNERMQRARGGVSAR